MKVLSFIMLMTSCCRTWLEKIKEAQNKVRNVYYLGTLNA